MIEKITKLEKENEYLKKQLNSIEANFRKMADGDDSFAMKVNLSSFEVVVTFQKEGELEKQKKHNINLSKTIQENRTHTEYLIKTIKERDDKILELEGYLQDAHREEIKLNKTIKELKEIKKWDQLMYLYY